MPKKAPGKTFTYKCKICNTQFKNGDGLHKHLKTSKCMRGSILRGLYDSDQSRLVENDNEYDSATYICGVCNCKFASGPDLELHMSAGGCVKPAEEKQSTQSEKEKQFTCGFCSMNFSSDFEVSSHVAISHPFPVAQGQSSPISDDQYSCGKCQASFDSATSLERHVYANTCQVFMSFTCGLCQTSFAEAETLSKHMQEHLAQQVGNTAVKLSPQQKPKASQEENNYLHNNEKFNDTSSTSTNENATLAFKDERCAPENQSSAATHRATIPGSRHNTLEERQVQLEAPDGPQDKRPTKKTSEENQHKRKAPEGIQDGSIEKRRRKETDAAPASSPSIPSTSSSTSSLGIPSTSSSLFNVPSSSSSWLDIQLTGSSLLGIPSTSSSLFNDPSTGISSLGIPSTSSSLLNDPSTGSSSLGIPSTSTSSLGGTSTSCSTKTPSGLSTGKSYPVEINPRLQEDISSNRDFSNLGINAECPSCKKPGQIFKNGLICNRCKLIFSNFKCEYCAEGFSDISSLVKHLTSCRKKNAKGQRGYKGLESSETTDLLPTAKVKTEPVSCDDSVEFGESLQCDIPTSKDSPVNDSSEDKIHGTGESSRERLKEIADTEDSSSELSVDKKPNADQMRKYMGRFRNFIQDKAKHLNLSPSRKDSESVAGMDTVQEKPVSDNTDSMSSSSAEVEPTSAEEHDMLSGPSNIGSHTDIVITSADVPNIAENSPPVKLELGYSNPANSNKQKLVSDVSFIVTDSESEISDSSGFEEIDLDDNDFEEITLSVAEKLKKTIVNTHNESAKEMDKSLQISKNDGAVGKDSGSDTKMKAKTKSKDKTVRTRNKEETFKTGVFVMDSDEDSSDCDLSVAQKKRKKMTGKSPKSKRKQQTKKARETKLQRRKQNARKTPSEMVIDVKPSSEVGVTAEHKSAGVDSNPSQSQGAHSYLPKPLGSENITSNINDRLIGKSQKNMAHTESMNKQKVHKEAHLGKTKDSDTSQSDSDKDTESYVEDFVCGECKQYFVSLASLRKHLKEHSEQQSETDNVTHVKSERVSIKPPTVTPAEVTDLFVCGICQLQTSTADELSAHVQTHSYILQFKCTMCTHIYPSKETLQQHMKDHILMTEEFVCGLCSSSFSSVASLEAHMASHSATALNVSHPASTEGPAIMADNTETSPLVKKSLADSTQVLADLASEEMNKVKTKSKTTHMKKTKVDQKIQKYFNGKKVDPKGQTHSVTETTAQAIKHEKKTKVDQKRQINVDGKSVGPKSQTKSVTKTTPKAIQPEKKVKVDQKRQINISVKKVGPKSQSNNVTETTPPAIQNEKKVKLDSKGQTHIVGKDTSQVIKHKKNTKVDSNRTTFSEGKDTPQTIEKKTKVDPKSQAHIVGKDTPQAILHEKKATVDPKVQVKGSSLVSQLLKYKLPAGLFDKH